MDLQKDYIMYISESYLYAIIVLLNREYRLVFMKKTISIGLFLIISVFVYGIDQGVIINEVASTGAYEFIELHNPDATPIDLDERWSLIDSKEGIADADTAILIPKGTIIEAGGYLVIAPYKTQLLSDAVPEEIPEDVLAVESFWLSSHDELTLMYEDTILESISWETSVNSMGRDPDDPGNFISGVLVPTPGEKNERDPLALGTTDIVINEVCSKGIDFIELYNNGDTDYEFSSGDWTLHDSRRNDSFVIPDGTTIKSHGLLVIYPDLIRLPLSAPRYSIASQEGNRFGLSERDTIYLRYKNSIVDMTSWMLHVSSKGRYPDGSASWDEDLLLSPGKTNRN